MSSNFGVMMTLAQLSALSPNPRPSGESPQQQGQRILTGINNLLQDGSLATGGLWQANWLALTQDGGNLCYIASSPTQNAFAVCCRGTQFNSLVDLGEDLEVGAVAQFNLPGAGSPLLVSQGSMKAFTEITTVPGLLYGNLLEALSLLLSSAPAAPTVYVTGHSLGGAMATMVALYLAAQTWAPLTPTFQVYTFAAPSAGLQSFASYYDEVFTSKGLAWRVYNAWDAVPYAWADLSNVQTSFYPAAPSNPSQPGPVQSLGVSQLLSKLAALPNGNVYFQTNGNSSTGPNTTVLDNGVSAYQPDTNFVYPTLTSFLGQVGYQHNCYLQLLGVSGLPKAGLAGGPPQVESISPNYGPVAGGTQVTISGGNFTPDCVVDFGTVPALMISITATQIVAVQPPGVGTVDVRVTNAFGTSAVTLADQFTAPAPLAPTVSSVTPIAVTVADTPTYEVEIIGTGFVLPAAEPYVVNFGPNNPATNVQVNSLTEITVTPPQSGSGSVNVQVTNSLGTSAADTGEFWFNTPVVTGVSPSSGPAKNSPNITITGLGFQQGCTVQFSAPAPVRNYTVTPTSVTPPTSIELTPPQDIVILDGSYNVIYDLLVVNPGGSIGQNGPVGPVSEPTPNDLYLYYPS
ncbi:MAG TPA: IPT/TIG domain-containing protein [Candidatus Angelobacter sp.]|nr:IPT/TIG domain-containing protein [Candidatus Angelobacter sp.]